MKQIEEGIKKWFTESGRSRENWKHEFTFEQDYQGSDWITVNIIVRKPRVRKHGYSHFVRVNTVTGFTEYMQDKYFAF